MSNVMILDSRGPLLTGSLQRKQGALAVRGYGINSPQRTAHAPQALDIKLASPSVHPYRDNVLCMNIVQAVQVSSGERDQIAFVELKVGVIEVGVAKPQRD